MRLREEVSNLRDPANSFLDLDGTPSADRLMLMDFALKILRLSIKLFPHEPAVLDRFGRVV
jgi:hypothetical protein